MRFLIIASLCAAATSLVPTDASAMGSTQFGTYSQAYLDRQKCKVQQFRCLPVRSARPGPEAVISGNK